MNLIRQGFSLVVEKAGLLRFRGTEEQSTLKEFYFKIFFRKGKQDLGIGI
jgi:hypothetical protein